ncbi:helix-turn-helix domain-containing protein [Neobacillus pocheonensis]|uniref:helix-turn-helix domain-containing protein n=1 Tax=Neobacillus pocheonensis TaxID=363869 RepID=UPI003D2D7AA8
MNHFESILLYCLKKLNNERTIYSIFHLLNGKKSSQTIQDAHLFSLKKFFGIYDTLTRESFENKIDTMLEKQWINNSGEHRFIITPSGELYLNNNQLPQYLNGWSYHLFTTLFWERLSLLIQVASNFVYQETKYSPIQKSKDVHIWLKSLLKVIQVPRQTIGKRVYSELVECFTGANDIDPSVIIFRLTGFQQIGLTSSQTAKKLKMDIHDYDIEFVNILHYLINKISSDTIQYPILSSLIDHLEQSNELTLSSRKTWNLFNQGYSPEVIADKRNLKMSTIEDHFVEFALHLDDFSIDDYVDRNLQEIILEVSRQSDTRQLKLIRDKVNSVSYFQIRLVLAKYGDRSWN